MIENQKNIFNLLKQSKQNDRLSHAYLFYGDEGVGKKELAYALACLFYCEHGGCLECETCDLDPNKVCDKWPTLKCGLYWYFGNEKTYF